MGCGASSPGPAEYQGNVVMGNGKFVSTPQQSDDSLALQKPSEDDSYNRGRPIKVLSMKQLRNAAPAYSDDNGSFDIRGDHIRHTGLSDSSISLTNTKSLPRSKIPVSTPAPKADPVFETIQSASPVKVAVVVRPLLDFEVSSRNFEIINVIPPSKILAPGLKFGGKSREKDITYEYDKVYKADKEETDKQLFQECVAPLLDRFCQGFNATIFAYGQTGAGKTYTMGNTATLRDFTTNNPKRIIPRAVQHVFKYMATASRNYDIIVKAMYYEIYNENIQDLLEPELGGDVRFAPAAPSIIEKENGEVAVENLTEVTITALSDIAALLSKGNEKRVTASHNLNEYSSRSHAILTFSIEQRAKVKPRDPIPVELRVLRSKLHLVDLAGSERMNETGTQGAQFKEGVNINKGLLELGNVINALSAGWKHVPYRNSKLTRVLQDSLGGNTETLMVACCAPGRDSHEHTLSTLRYALRARNIKNFLHLNNQVSLEEEIAYLKKVLVEKDQEIADLRQQVKQLSDGLSDEAP